MILNDLDEIVVMLEIYVFDIFMVFVVEFLEGVRFV